MPEGEVKKLLINKAVICEKQEAYYLKLARSNAENITDFAVLRNGSLTFETQYRLPKEVLQNELAEWSVTGLPTGLECITSSVAGNPGSVVISGYAEQSGTFDVTVSVSIGEYSDSKVYNLVIDEDENIPELIVKFNNDVYGSNELKFDDYSTKSYEFYAQKSGVTYSSTTFFNSNKFHG